MFDNEFFEAAENHEKNLAAEIDVLPWVDLVRHFAFGRLYVVRAPWTLLEAAETLKADNANALKSAMEKGEFGTPSNLEAESWHESRQEFDVLVLSPFVLVSPRY